MKPILIILIIITSLILLFFLILLIIYKMAFYNDNKTKQLLMISFDNPQYKPYKDYMLKLIEKAKNLPYEEIKIKSFDNKTLFGKYYHINDNAPIDIYFHGYKGTPVSDFSGGINISINNGHNFILVDQRGCGKSDGITISFGIKERYDTLSWVNYVNNRFGKNIPITLIGISMGASTVLMASNLTFTDNVKAIIADCPFSNPLDMILIVAKKKHINPKIVKPFVILSAKIIGNFNINEANVLQCVKESNLPILLIHGTDDHLVPYYMSEEIAKVNKKIELHLFEAAPHGISFIINQNKYENIVNNFISQRIKISTL